MAWVFLDGTKITSPTTLNRMVFDGRDMWATTQASVKIFSYYGEDDGSSYDIDLSTYISDCYYIVKGYDHMYIFDFNVTTFVKVNINTRSVVSKTLLPFTANCEPEYGRFKLWFVTAETDLKQYLVYYNIDDGTWSSQIQLPGRHQSNKRLIKWSRNGYIYVNLLNENGIGKFNDITGAYMSTIITNRLPQSIYINNDRDVIVSGFNGMVSSVDQLTDISTNISGIKTESTSVVDDGNYLWSIQPSMVRIDKSTTIDNYIEMIPSNVVTSEIHSDVYFGFGFALNNPNVVSITNVTESGNPLTEGVDYTFDIDPTFGEQRMVIIDQAPNVTGTEPLSISVSYNYTTNVKDFNVVGFTDTTFKQVDITPTYTHEYWDGSAIQTKTEPQRVVLLADNAIYFGYNLTDSWTLPETRNYQLDILGTAMIGVGPDKYYGETV